MATVTVNVQADTTQATAGVDDLNQSLNQTEQSSEDLSNSLEKQEARIKTLGGAINILGGSVEVLAGGLLLSGALTEEQVEKFQAAAVGAIAFADGTKRIFEGTKELAEGLKLAKTAQVGYNSAVLANPYVAAAAAVAVLAAGIFVLYQRTKLVITEEQRREGQLNTINKQTEEAERIQAAYNLSLAEEFSKQEDSIRLLKARGGSLEEIFAAEEKLIKLRIAARRDELAEQERQNEELGRAIKLAEEAEKATGGRVEGLDELRTAYNGVAESVSAQRTAINSLETDLTLLGVEAGKSIREREEAAEQEAYDAFVEREEKKKGIIQKRIDADIAAAKVAADISKANKQIAEEEAAFKEQAIQGGIDNIQGALGALFGENKAVASANVLIDAAQAGVGIIKNSQSTGPLAIAYQASQFALLGATTVASLRQINSAEPGGAASAPSTPRPGGLPTTGTTPGLSGPGFNLGAPQLGGNSGVTTISAVVLAGDVTSAQAQNDAIRNRRRFG